MRLPLLLLPLLLAACGQSGDLYRPDAVPAPKPVSVPVVAPAPAEVKTDEEDQAPASPSQLTPQP